MKTRKGALGAIFLVVLLDLFGFGIVLPLLPYYAARFEASSLAVGFLYSIYSFAQLGFSPLWGTWSDKIGRRPIMLISTAGSTGSYLLFAFSNSLPMLFMSRLFAGVMGGNISAAQAYIADVTTPAERAKGMGILGAAFGIGFALGPAISGLLLLPSVHEAILRLLPAQAAAFVSENPYSLPGFAAAALSFSSFLLVTFLLPESLRPGEIEDTTRVQKVSVFSRQFWPSVFSKDSHAIARLYLCLFILMIGHSSLYSAFPLFCKQVMGMDAHQVAMQFLWLGIVTVLIQGGAIRPLVKKFGEQRLLITGNVLMVAALISIPSAQSPAGLVARLCVLAVGASLNGPTLTSLISKEASPSHVGLVMGNAQAISAMGRVLGPALGGLLFGWKAQAPFFLMAVLLSTTIWIAFTTRLHDIP